MFVFMVENSSSKDAALGYLMPKRVLWFIAHLEEALCAVLFAIMSDCILNTDSSVIRLSLWLFELKSLCGLGDLCGK